MSANSSMKYKASSIQYPFWFGGSAASMAACVTHPFDLIKVRLQTRTADAPRNMSSTFVKMFKSEGLLGFYSGLSASVLRQLTYSTVRFGIYEEVKQKVESDAGFPLLVAVAASSGFIGGLVGNFADVLNVRMQNDTALPLHQRRNYRHVLDGVTQMTREEGMVSWFRGWSPNCTRAAATTAGQLATYDIAKQFLLDYTPLEDTLWTQLLASFQAGLMTATVTNPIDVAKTRAMSSKETLGMLELMRNLSRAEGVRWIFKGWIPSFLRQGPHTICIFLFLEMHRKAYRQLQGI